VDIEYKRSVSSYGVGLNLIEGKNVIQVYGVDRSLKQIKEFEQTADKVIEDTILARNTSTLSGGKYPAIFIPSSLGDVFMSFMDGINGKVVAKGVSPLIGKIGQSILDERITIIDDCQHEQGLFSSPVDDEGIRGQKTMIVEKGVLKNYITDLNSAEQLGLQCTGNGFRALPFEHTRHYRTPVEVCISNLILEPGNISYEDMLKEIKTGIEVHHITGILLGNLTNGDFSGNLELAYKIQNGKRVGRIRDTMISGNFYQLFKNNILGIGNSQVWTGFFGGSSGSMLLPHVLLKDVELSGKH
jgi:PmbA protein